MATFHENLVQSFHNFRDKYLKANGNFFKFSYDATTQKYGFTINGTFHPFKSVQASKTVTASTSAQTVTPDSGYDGVASVTVNPTPSQKKYAYAEVNTHISVTPDSGNLLSEVVVYPRQHNDTYNAVNMPINEILDMGIYNDYRYFKFNGYFFITQITLYYVGSKYRIAFTGGRYKADGTIETGSLAKIFDGNTFEYEYPFYYNIVTIRITRNGSTITKIEVKSTDTKSRYYVGLIGLDPGTGSPYNWQTDVGVSGKIVKTNGDYQTLWSGSIQTFLNFDGTTAPASSAAVIRSAIGRFAMFAIPRLYNS